MTDPIVAVDLGGTKIAAALVDDHGAILTEAQQPTGAWEGGDTRGPDARPADPEAIAANVDRVVADLLDGSGLRAPLRVGVGSAGPIDVASGTVSPVNIPAWRRFPLLQRVADAVAWNTGQAPLRARLAGDGHCIALGEQWVGAGRGRDDVIAIICSTGVGGGIVIGGRLFPGGTGNAVHVGHTSVNAFGPRCRCGTPGCVEYYASGPGMVRRARELGWKGPDAVALTRAASAGDPIASQAVDEGMRALGAGLAALVTNFDVPTVVVGGGVSKAGETVFAPLRRHFAEFVQMSFVSAQAEILRAELPNAGLLGAAKLVLD